MDNARSSSRASAWLAAGAAGWLLAAAAAAQELPLVSRQLQFHAVPGEAGAEALPPGVTQVPVILSNIPNRPLPPGTRFVGPLIDPETGLYVPGVAGERGVVLPETPAQLPSAAMPPLARGQTYLPPWWDDVRNVRGGFGPADPGPVERGVRPEDLQITPPPAAATEGLPETPPAAPVQDDVLAPAPPTPAQQLAPPAPQPVPAPAAEPAPRERSQTAPPAPDAAGPLPLVSRKLNFQY